MAAEIFDGKTIAAQIKSELKPRVAALREAGLSPSLGTIIVGENPASKIYVQGKHDDCAEVGIKSVRIELPEDACTEDVLAAVDSLNGAPSCTGFIVQLPLPPQIDTDAVLARINPTKDADGLHPLNLGALVLNTAGEFNSPIPCTPRGIVELGRRYGLDWNGKNVCVVGQGRTVGRPLSLLLSHESINATVDTCHIGTRSLAEHTLRADVIVAAAGAAHLLKAEMVAPHAVVFDVGVTREVNPETGKGKILGDVSPEVAQKVAGLSPNPGGVGPMTRAMLLVNIVEQAERVLQK
ncbi:MAG: bifunctional methylenetetrahydrofolate dehydrogenase/methenyltetrahydrofolate cyclohydrolase [Arcanobacterium sp.]|nr:bifunctional methylenetetrahydrofolate dehydrogenase/methenyltetrahydrofolate cyclohydrolase [Arcanobacterium sp.]